MPGDGVGAEAAVGQAAVARVRLARVHVAQDAAVGVAREPQHLAGVLGEHVGVGAGGVQHEVARPGTGRGGDRRRIERRQDAVGAERVLGDQIVAQRHEVGEPVVGAGHDAVQVAELDRVTDGRQAAVLVGAPHLAVSAAVRGAEQQRAVGGQREVGESAGHVDAVHRRERAGGRVEAQRLHGRRGRLRAGVDQAAGGVHGERQAGAAGLADDQGSEGAVGQGERRDGAGLGVGDEDEVVGHAVHSRVPVGAPAGAG